MKTIYTRRRSFEKYNISAALKQPQQNAPRQSFELTELIGLNGLNGVEDKVFTKQRRKPYLFSFFYVRLLRTGRFHFEKKMKYFVFSKEHRGAYLCPTFTEGGTHPRNTVLIAFEGFNLISVFFLPICITVKGFITFVVNYYICGFNTHILYFICCF